MKKLLLPLFLFMFVSLMNAQTAGTLSVTTTTRINSNDYGSSHIMAIWVQNSSGTFVKSVCAFAATRVNELTSWVANSAKNKVGLVSTGVDVTTGATLTTHATKTYKWTGTNVSSAVVADGTYTIKLELADGGASKVSTYTIVKGSTNTTGVLSGTAAACFTNTSIQWVPTNTGIDEVKLAKLYSVYPNPTKSSIFVSGTDIKEIELCDLSGKRIFISNEQKVNLANLSKGTYLAKVKTEKGTFIKKIIKE